jgi:hypothetical protein
MTAYRLRIAVVDTGINANHPHICAPTHPVLFDRSDAALPCDDVLGHGTAVTAAIQEKAPDADYYILKIFDNSLRTTGTPPSDRMDHRASNGCRESEPRDSKFRSSLRIRGACRPQCYGRQPFGRRAVFGAGSRFARNAERRDRRGSRLESSSRPISNIEGKRITDLLCVRVPPPIAGNSQSSKPERN